MVVHVAGRMNAHVEMLARLHTRTKFSHTKAMGERGGKGGVRGGLLLLGEAGRRRRDTHRLRVRATPLPLPVTHRRRSGETRADGPLTSLTPTPYNFHRGFP
ncbi:unnamed protein product [Pleuronectes platessa]|uniref:Uncharacterized protein n=1 Tax=Pleuronectes platessa TaxID=8262 RepID=A0A9N7W4C2_PLEPL|nr:unnamed protein product [Pleuronectes platessa]